jgi:hypothetical protein
LLNAPYSRGIDLPLESRRNLQSGISSFGFFIFEPEQVSLTYGLDDSIDYEVLRFTDGEAGFVYFDILPLFLLNSMILISSAPFSEFLPVLPKKNSSSSYYDSLEEPIFSLSKL